jgi:hypothetical protein
VFILHSVKLLWIVNWEGYVRSDGGAWRYHPRICPEGLKNTSKVTIVCRRFKVGTYWTCARDLHHEVSSVVFNTEV